LEFRILHYTNDWATGKVFKDELEAGEPMEAVALAAQFFLRQGALLGKDSDLEVAGPESVARVSGRTLLYWLKNGGEPVARREGLSSLVSALERN